jgi:hypothetical protein
MSHPTPKKLTIFLIDGEPTGAKEVEVGNWSGMACVIPRNRLEIVDQRDKLKTQCVYFLIGTDEPVTIYIGEAEDFSKRIKEHHRSKDFWNIAIAFFSKDTNLTKAHVKYLESKFIKECAAANRVSMENGNVAGGAKLPEADVYEMDEFVERCKMILSTLGYTFLEQASKQQEGLHLLCSFKGHEARGVYTDEGMIILAGSELAKEPLKANNEKTRARRIEMIETVAEDKGEYYLLKKDMLFGSVSAASGFILARASNGWLDWKDANGKTLDEIKRKGI